MRFVPIKTDDQLDLQALHRVRERLVSRRTAVINQIRAFLLERGITFRKGPASLRRQMPEILENAEVQLSPRIRSLLATMWEEWKQLDHQVESFTTQIEAIGSDDPVCQRLREIPGVGPLIASVVVASIGNGAAFNKGRDFAAWLGLIPKQFSTGGKVKLLGISKRGNRYLRTMFIHGARSLVLRFNRKNSPLGDWISSLEARAQCGDCSHGTQSGADHLGCAVKRRAISLRDTGGLSSTNNLSHEVCRRETTDERTVKRRR
jgi:transposase